MFTNQTADVNGDGSSDIVCTGLEGGMMVWEAKDVADFAHIYQANSKWTDVNFGFCVHTNKMVIILPKSFYKVITIKKQTILCQNSNGRVVE